MCMDIKDIYLQSQTHNIISLDRSRGMLSHAYMIECADEYILDNYVRLVAQEIFCLNKHTPCFECNNCKKVEHSNMVDLKIYPRDNKGIIVDDINEIVSDAYIKPIDSENKVFVLKDFDNATTQAQNKLLKTLEEPPTNVIFILTCANSNSVLQTIRSRVKTISESLLDTQTVAEFLSNKVSDAESVASVSGGSISVAMKLASNGDAGKIIDLALDTLIGLRSSADVLKYSSKIIALKKEFPFYLDTLISIIRDVAICGSPNLLNFKNKQKEILALSKIYSSSALAEISENLTEIYNKLDFNCNITGVVDQMLLNILEVKFLCQK